MLVSVGSYHHPFDRLIEWIEPWATEHPEVAFTVQHGPGRPMAGAANADFLAYDDLMELIASSDLVVLQGGAGGLMDARDRGRLPVLVPRVPLGNEVVDDHQLLFTKKAGELGLAHNVTTQQGLHELLDGFLVGSVDTRTERGEPTPGVARVAELLSVAPSSISRRSRARRVFRRVRGRLRGPGVGGA